MLQVRRLEFYRIDLRLRFPFRFGIASVSEMPHLIVRADVDFDGRSVVGVAAEGLPPKWFTKNPESSFEEDDLPGMKRVIRNAAELAIGLGSHHDYFSWWWELYQAQHAWARESETAPLLAGLGTSLMERAVIDAFCRHENVTLFDALRQNRLGIKLAVMRPELGDCQPADVLPPRPRERVALRHTVGLGDPLTDGEISADHRATDGLPHSLLSNLKRYGLQRFKIKLSGHDDQDRQRLADLARLLPQHAGPEVRLTLDGNEQYPDVDSFRNSWDHLQSNTSIRQLLRDHLLFVEQPIHRSHALDPAVGEALEAWPDRPPIIIDESDAELASFPAALRLGYGGTSHKNCKGVLKSIAAAATVAQARARSNRLILSAEDLINIGPIALQQDLAVVAALGIRHVERNGHHYLPGLSMFPIAIQNQVCREHPDLYAWNERGFAALTITDGGLSLQSINRAGFGVPELPDLSLLETWEL